MKKMVIPVLLAAVVACRDAARTPDGPRFAVATDSGGGGCDATVCHFNARGAAADVNWFDPGTSVSPSDTGSTGGGVQVFGFLSVSQGATGTLLYYGILECRSWGCNTVGGGYGTIPNQDLTGNTRSMHLNTNTTGNPNFFTYAGSSGTIDVTWSGNDLFSYHANGTTRRTQPGLSEQETGQSDYVSATAAGTVVSYRIFAGNSGTLSSSHNATIVINH